MCRCHQSVAELLGRFLHCFYKTLTQQYCRRPMDGGGGTPRIVLLTGTKKSHLGCMISFELPMGFQNFVVVNEIHPKKK